MRVSSRPEWFTAGLPEGCVIEQVPPEVREAAREAFSDRDPGVRVADLVEDSLLADPAPPGPRRLVFRAQLPSADGAAADGTAADGQAVYDVHVALTVRPCEQQEGARILTAACDEPQGRLTAVTSAGSAAAGAECPAGPGPWVVHVQAGLVRLVLEVHGRRLRTTWVRV